MSSSDPAKPRTKRRWLQFRLRTLLAVMTLLAMVMGLISPPLRRHMQERLAVQTVERLGGRMVAEYQPTRGSSLISKVFGDKIYLRLVDIDLRGTAAGDADLKNLAPLRQLRRLVLAETAVTDEGLGYLAKMTSLHRLDLADTRVTDAGMASLEQLRNLWHVDLTGTAVSYEAIAALDRSLPHARDLCALRAAAEIYRLITRPVPKGPPESITAVRLAGSQIEQGLPHLRYLPELRSLDFGGYADTTDAMLAGLKDLTRLSELDLEEASVTGPGLEHLAGLDNLDTLVLRSTPLDDDGLKHLPAMPRLKRLDLARTNVTGLGMAELQRLPALEALDLSHVEPIYDADLMHLKDLEHLCELRLDYARVGGWAIEEFAGVSRLRSLVLAKSHADPDVVARLAELAPGARIELYQHIYDRIVGRFRSSPEQETAFWRGDYDRLVALCEEAAPAPHSSSRHLLELADAYCLAGDFARAVETYHRVIESMTGAIDESLEPSRDGQRMMPSTETWHSRENVLLRTAQLELYELHDPAAAAATAAEGMRYAPVGSLPLGELSARTADVLRTLDRPDSHRPVDPLERSGALGPLAFRAEVCEKQGDVAAALHCWTVARLLELNTNSGSANTDPFHIAALWAELDPKGPWPVLPIFAVITEQNRRVTLRPDRGETRRIAWGNLGWDQFAVVPQPGMALARLEIQCTIEGHQPGSTVEIRLSTHGRDRDCPTVSLSARASPQESWADPHVETFVFDLPQDADMWFLSLPEDGQGHGVSELTLRGTLRRRGSGEPLPEPRPPKPSQPDPTAPIHQEIVALDVPRHERTSVHDAAIVELPDGRWLMAFVTGPPPKWRIMLTTSRDGRSWQEPWEFSQNSIFDNRRPTLIVDDTGDVWMWFDSTRLDLGLVGRPLLWRSQSKDGRVWSLPAPVQTSSLPAIEGPVQPCRDAEGNYWLFHRDEAGSGDSPEVIRHLRPLPLVFHDPHTEITRSRAAFDPHGRCHLVFCTKEALYYCWSDDMRTWSPRVEINPREERSSIRPLSLLLEGRRMAVLYKSGSDILLRRGLHAADALQLGEPILLDSGIYSANVLDPCLFSHDGNAYLPLGGKQPRLLRMDRNRLLGNAGP